MRRACCGLAWPAVACALLLCARAAAAVEVAPGICPSVDIRTDVDGLGKLRGCRVVEGFISIVLLEHSKVEEFTNMTFPELREVKDYVIIYRMQGARNLGHLFPNLSVIRGQKLFKDFALIVFDSQEMEMLGLKSLTTIERGGIRIQNNDKMCYANTVAWDRIIKDMDATNIIRSNYDTRLCGLCPNAQSRKHDHRLKNQCPSDSEGRLLCWDDKHCQKVCPAACNDTCMDDGTCCHSECLGGCDGPGVTHCHVCRHFSIGYGENTTCTRTCPAGTYQLYSRCVTEQECRQMPPPNSNDLVQGNQPLVQSYKIHNNQCVWLCPSGYMDNKTEKGARCEPCTASKCLRECKGGKIDSIGSTDQFRGCTHINGDLEISIRAAGSNTMAELEKALGDVRVINGGLRVSRSTPLVSLMFLKNLETIHANTTKDNISLFIFANPNLETLWDFDHHKRIELQGRFFIHFNPKLCYRLIQDLGNMSHINFTDMDVSNITNGDQAPCYKQHLDFSVSQLHSKLVILTWDMYCADDSRKLLGYSVYYIATEQNVTLYGQRDACSDSWMVRDITMEDFKKNNNSKEDSLKDQSTEMLTDPCKFMQPLFYLLSGLTPFTRYAAYVKTYTVSQDRDGAQSSIIYFTTLPERPSPPQSLSVDHVDPRSVFIRWHPPAMPNGTIIMYHVEIQANSYNRETIAADTTSYCNNPSKLTTLLRDEAMREKEKEIDKPYLEAGNETCACSAELGPGLGPLAPAPSAADRAAQRFSRTAEQERQDSIQFENDLQNAVYFKKDKHITERSNKTRVLKFPRRLRRSVEPASILSTFVVLSSNTPPKLGLHNYTNTTEGGYMKSLYFELDGNTHSLAVSNLWHFTWYTVNVWACRERHANETLESYGNMWCSDRAYHTFRTMELPNADIVRDVRAVVVASNKTLPEVNVTWAPPASSNGFVVAYTVHYSRLEDTSQSQDGLQNCITASECKNATCSTVLRSLLPGNYSVRVTPISVSGAGNSTAQAYVFIEERAVGQEWIWGVICGCVILILILGLGIWYAKREFLQPAEANKLFASVNPEYVSTVYVPDEWEVPRCNIEFIRELGQGSFGMVYEGIAKNIEKGKPETRCAVKTVNEHATDRERIEFLNEASVMKAFDTHHVVRLLGVVSRGQPTLVVMELMECGDLKTYLRSHRPDSESSLPKKDKSNTPPTLQNILQMAIEIADGMAYLSAKKFVHRDLAARNCMVAGDLTVKVGDFGMTRDIYETDYYRKGTKGLLPVRWMSPESLKDGVFSSNSDVWSYGVVLWEMATLAMQPYQGLSNEQVVRYVVEGGVMERPEHCPDRLYELMRACWQHRAAARPSFLQLVADLAAHAHQLFRQRSFFHSPHGQELYKLHQTVAAAEEDGEMAEVNVGAVATGSGSNLFGVSGRLASWVRELSSLRSRTSDDAAAEPLQPAAPLALPKQGPNGVLPRTDTTHC